MGKYFGTDGFRGEANKTLTVEHAFKVGRYLGWYYNRNHKAKIVIGKDTRRSSYMFEYALVAGLTASGADAYLLHVTTTPSVSYIVRTDGFDCGIMISASHNPYYDNGIKFFSSQGTKLPDDIEEAIEAMLDQPMDCVESADLGKASRISDAAGRYIEFCKSTFPAHLGLDGYKIVVDCANGATYHIAPNVLRELGAEVIEIGTDPNGININEKCGATDVKALQEKVLETKADVGLAYDGDGDRIMMVDHLGNKVDGDQILFIIAREALRSGQLKGGVVGTLMSNMSLEIALKMLGVPFVRANVGDRYVLEKMVEHNWTLGGENSGHIIIADKNTTGDGIIASLAVLSAMVQHRLSLNELASAVKLFPQVLINVRFAGGDNPLESEAVKAVAADVEKRLEGKGRILLRKSGTEPLIRVMVECEDGTLAKQCAEEIAEAVNAN